MGLHLVCCITAPLTLRHYSCISELPETIPWKPPQCLYGILRMLEQTQTQNTWRKTFLLLFSMEVDLAADRGILLFLALTV